MLRWEGGSGHAPSPPLFTKTIHLQLISPCGIFYRLAGRPYRPIPRNNLGDCLHGQGTHLQPLFGNATRISVCLRKWCCLIVGESDLEGQCESCFRLIMSRLAFCSRVPPEPTYRNDPSNNFFPDQLFGFFWEDMGLHTVCFNLDADKILSSTRPRPLSRCSRTREENTSFGFDKSVTSPSTFKYSTDSIVTVGTESSGP